MAPIRARSPARPHDASRRDAGDSVPATILGRRRETVRPARAAGDPSVVIAGGPCRRLPGAIVGHRPFEREHAAVVISYYQEERDGGVIVGHAG
ncbi:MAG: hypothetical protein JO110_25360 [Acetobacteraceae bacterium]|nr:hypothetical protein [Acetobacteraceae bacterium]